MTQELDLVLRILCAALLGGLIGLEREYRSKEAGFRTHFLVAMGSALFMVVSAYGFSDSMNNELQRWDVSRVASQVVSGIGFIGAGTIIFRKQENVVSGLTTAAGVWVVAAIGLACGGGMYVVATASTVLVLAGLEAFNYISCTSSTRYARNRKKSRVRKRDKRKGLSLIVQCCSDGCAEFRIFRYVEVYTVQLFQHGIDVLALGQQRQVAYQYKVLDA